MTNFLFTLPLAVLSAATVYYAPDVGVSYAILPALIGALGVLGAAGIGAGANAWMSDRQEEAAERNREWQSEENELNRQFQHGEWLSQFNATNEYNDPKKQMQRLAAAGINPAAAFGGGQAALGQSQASPSAPSGASTSVTTPYVDSDYYNPWRAAEHLGSALQKFASLPAEIRESSRVKAQVENLQSQTDLNRIDSQARDFEFQIRKLYGNDQEAQRYLNSMMEYNQIVQVARKYAAEADTEEARKLLVQAETAKEKALQGFHGANKRLIELQADYYGKNVESEIKKNEAISREAYASANLSDKQSHFQHLQNQIREKTKSQEIFMTLKQMRAKGQISDSQYQNAKNELRRLQKVGKGYDNSNAMLTIDAGIENLRKILGVSVGVNYTGNEK